MADWDERENPTATERADAAAYQSRIASLQAEVERLTRELGFRDKRIAVLGDEAERRVKQIHEVAVQRNEAEAELAKLREGAEPVAWLARAHDGPPFHGELDVVSPDFDKPAHWSAPFPVYLRPTTEQTDARSGVRVRAIAEDAIKMREDGHPVSAYNLAKMVLSALSPAAPEGRFAKLSPDAPATIREDADKHLARLSTAELVAAPEGRRASVDEFVERFFAMAEPPLSEREKTIAAMAVGYATARPTERAVTEAWREITEDDQPPLDTDVIMGHWLTVSTRPTEWLVEVGHYGSKRGGWIHGGATHWLPLDVLPAAPALALEGK